MPGRTDDVFDDFVRLFVGLTVGAVALLLFALRPVVFVVGLVSKPLAARLTYHLRPSFSRKEVRETHALLNEAAAAYQASFLAEQPPDDLLADILVEIRARCDEPQPSNDILLSFADVIYGLMMEEGWWELPAIDGELERTLEEGMHLRNHLRHQKRLFTEAPDLFEVWSEKLIRIGVGLLAYLPNEGESSDDEDGTASHLSVPLVDLADNPAEMIERLVVTFFDDDVTDTGLFADMRTRLDANALIASGIDPTERHRSTKRIQLPTDLHKTPPTDLVHTYLRATAFEHFFLTDVAFELPPSVLFEHALVLGGTGHGKTTFLKSQIHTHLVEALNTPCSIVVIDSQGDLINTIAHLSLFSPHAENNLSDRFLLIDPNDVEHPISLNMFDINVKRLKGYSALERERVLNGAIDMYEYLFGALLGAELTQKQGVVFRYLARLMLAIPQANIQTLREVLEDGRPYKPYMAELTGSSRKFFETQFFHPSFNATKTQMLRRLWGVLANPTFERMFSSPVNKVDLFDAMNEGKIILINTAKDLLKQEGCEILGRFFIAMIAQAAMQRSVLPKAERTNTYVFVDEAHEYFDERLETILNQARKYNVGITLCAQNLGQFPSGLEQTVMSSTTTKFAGGVSSRDARVLAPEMRTESEFLQSMRKRTGETEFACYIRNVTPRAIRVGIPLGAVDDLPTVEAAEFDELLEQNRRRYCMSADEIERAMHEPRLTIVEDEELATPDDEDHTVSPLGSDEEQPDAAESEAATPAPPGEDAERRIQDSLEASDREPVHKRRPVLKTPRPQGKGGRKHQMLQQELHQAAQARGYYSVIEKRIGGTTESVDVALERGGYTIACEVSVTTAPEHEQKNVAKCLAAGFHEVLVISSNKKHLQRLRRHISESLSEDERSRVLFLAPLEVLPHLDEIEALQNEKEETVLGYKVRVSHARKEGADAAARKRALADVIVGSMRAGTNDTSPT